MSSTDEFLRSAGVDVGRGVLRWWDLGILGAYVGANVVGALGVYWGFRVRKR